MFFKLLRPKGNLCGGGGSVIVLNPKYLRLLSRDAMRLIHMHPFQGPHNYAMYGIKLKIF